MLGHAVQAEPGPQHAGGLGQLRGVHDAIGAARLGGGREAKLTLHLQPLHGARDGALADAVGAGSLAGEYICIHDSMFWGASQVRMRPGRERESLTQQLVTRL